MMRVCRSRVFALKPWQHVPAPTTFCCRTSSSEAKEGELRSGARSMVHFRRTVQKHPLKAATWKNPTVNHIWTDSEIDHILDPTSQRNDSHTPTKLSDKITYAAVRTAYHAFNFVTGYRSADPSPSSVIYRLLILESIAGVPGMVAGSMRHFKSLRSLERDHGWIHTLLEEAENERMHLLTFMHMFEAGLVTRGAIVLGQGALLAALIALYAVHPKSMHRFVGYLEETAVTTYSDVLEKMDTSGTQLHAAWSGLPAPSIAIGYWRLPATASFRDVVRQIAADEAHHRDINHTFASMATDDPSPFIKDHLRDIDEFTKQTQKGNEMGPI